MPPRSIERQLEIEAVHHALRMSGLVPSELELGLIGTVDEALTACKRLFPDWWRHQVVSFVRYATGCTESTVITRMCRLDLMATWKVSKKWSKQ